MTTAITRHGAILQKPNDDQAEDIFQALDMQLNSMMVDALSHVSSKRWHDYGGLRSIPLILMIVLLYLLMTFLFCVNWVANAKDLIVNGQNFSMISKAYNNPFLPWICLVVGITAGVSTILPDATLIWRCWAVCSRNLHAIVVPVISTTLTVVSKGILLYHHCADGDLENMDLYDPDSSHWALIYSSAILVTLLWCMVLIIYNILSVAIDPCWLAMTQWECRVALGCACPDDYWSGSSVSESLRFTTSSASEQSQDRMDFYGIMSCSGVKLKGQVPILYLMFGC
ncbi:hypothetical protein IW261DRAFT_1426871 [Armillaria novae-zelandiae]|uniref:Uncharacterized protein n=1 Tax=Armillaria novae-zelandiae TaxID=153914 RepID=A0AA39TQ25_9AGAR|nr:hypothetical protein IW261DRAFT_1426871 [Armillaria novae-zelandiae]